jgi:hypothetical protein
VYRVEPVRDSRAGFERLVTCDVGTACAWCEGWKKSEGLKKKVEKRLDAVNRSRHKGFIAMKRRTESDAMKFSINTTEQVAAIINRVTGHTTGLHAAWHPGKRRCPITAENAQAVIDALEIAAIDDERVHAECVARETARGNEYNLRQLRYTNPGGDHRCAVSMIRARMAKLSA